MTDHQIECAGSSLRNIRKFIDNQPVAFFRLDRTFRRANDTHDVFAARFQLRYGRADDDIGCFRVSVRSVALAPAVYSGLNIDRPFSIVPDANV